jgi:hypothetical protein
MSLRLLGRRIILELKTDIIEKISVWKFMVIYNSDSSIVDVDLGLVLYMTQSISPFLSQC